MDNMTLTTTQQGRLQRAVKDRVNHLLVGVHSLDYKKYSRTYFINIWNGNIQKCKSNTYVNSSCQRLLFDLFNADMKRLETVYTSRTKK